MSEKELIWVPKEIAEKHKALESDSNKREEQIKVLNDYIATISEKSRKEFKCSLEAMEEDVAIYKGLMLQVRQSFEKAKDEALDASYTLWEKYDEERPSIHKKINDLIELLKPLKDELTTINDLLSKINTWNIDKLSESIKTLNSLYGESKDMVKFLIKNFKNKD